MTVYTDDFGFGTRFGRHGYGDDLEFDVIGVPTFREISPVDGEASVAADTTIEFIVTDTGFDLDPASITIYVQSAKVYANETTFFGYTVTRTVVPGGYSYVVQGPLDFGYRSSVEVAVYASDYLGNGGSAQFTFYIEASPLCFSGPNNDFEKSLLVPYTSTTLKFTEQMRQALLLNLIRTREPEAAIRALFLIGHEIELNPVLRDLVIPPTDTEKEVTLCQRVSLIEVYDSLQRKSVWMTNSIKELGALGLPIEHRRMLESYAQLTEPVLIVSLMCFLVMLAKALETT